MYISDGEKILLSTLAIYPRINSYLKPSIWWLGSLYWLLTKHFNFFLLHATVAYNFKTCKIARESYFTCHHLFLQWISNTVTPRTLRYLVIFTRSPSLPLKLGLLCKILCLCATKEASCAYHCLLRRLLALVDRSFKQFFCLQKPQLFLQET